MASADHDIQISPTSYNCNGMPIFWRPHFFKNAAKLSVHECWSEASILLEMEIPVKIVTKLVVHSKGLVAVLVLLCLKAFFARESELLPSRLLLFFGNGLLLLSYWNEIPGF